MLKQNKSILIVDEDPCLSDLLSILLLSHGYQTRVTSLSNQELNGIAQNMDLVILDMTLPEADIIHICQEFKINSATQDVPIIVISNNQGQSDRIKSLYLGISGYLTMPFEPEELLARIDMIINHPLHQSEDGRLLHEQEIIMELNRIIDTRAVHVYFQPVYHLESMRLLGLEMFSRPDTETEMADPKVFFDKALKHNLYYEVEMIGWKMGVKMAVDHFNGRQKLFLNCDPLLVQDGKFARVKDMFGVLGMPEDNAFLEIADRRVSAVGENFYGNLSDFRQLGFKVSVDNLEDANKAQMKHIEDIKPEAIKLDRKIVNGVAHDVYKKSVIKLMASYCRQHNVICIAEGIENKTDFEALIELGVDAGQGYYLYQPTRIIDISSMSLVR
ncbi:MAG: EAL domain-containing protein [Candidatus Omnitrophica bacterium]|nr:EAL domain-containing protein [Candidatus Omnitrophota bacterium]